MNLTFDKALKNILFYKKLTSQIDFVSLQSSLYLSELELLNSFKIDIALRYFNAIQNENWLTRLKFVASHWDIGISMYWNYFETISTERNQEPTYTESSQFETVTSFLDKCISIGKENNEYWVKVCQILDLHHDKIEPYLKNLRKVGFVISENGYEVVPNQYSF